MAFDGSGWNESSPVNSDLAADIDDYIRDNKIAVRSRMAHEHKWSSSQTATGSDGYHTFITLSTQTATPSLVYGTATQAACIFADTSNNVVVSDKTNVSYVIVKSAAGLVIANGTGTLGALPYVTSGGGTVLLGAGTSGYVLTAAGAAAPAWAAPTLFAVASGTANHGATIPLISGYASNQVTCFVSLNNSTSAVGTSNPDGIATVCSVDANRLITATWRAVGAGGSGTCVANYLIIGTK